MNTSVGLRPPGAFNAISRAHSTVAPIARKASRCGSRRRRPITSPPGDAITARPKRASRGPASRNDARIRSATSASTSTSSTAAAHSASSFGPRQLTSTPIARRMLSIASTSRMWGTLRTTTSSSVRTAEARMGRAPFLLPAGNSVPDSGTPPSMMNFSMSSTRRRRPHGRGVERRLASVTAMCGSQFAAAVPEPATQPTVQPSPDGGSDGIRGAVPDVIYGRRLPAGRSRHRPAPGFTSASLHGWLR